MFAYSFYTQSWLVLQHHSFMMYLACYLFIIKGLLRRPALYLYSFNNLRINLSSFPLTTFISFALLAWIIVTISSRTVSQFGVIMHCVFYQTCCSLTVQISILLVFFTSFFNASPCFFIKRLSSLFPYLFHLYFTETFKDTSFFISMSWQCRKVSQKIACWGVVTHLMFGTLDHHVR